LSPHYCVRDVTALRRALVDCLCCESGFEERRAALVDEYDLDDVAATGEPPASVTSGLDARDVELLDRVRRFDTAPLGLTLSGPAYRDNPILYANQTLRDCTGYSLDELRGENPRLFQGPDTDSDALERLHEAIDIWSEATVELWNYRRDGTRFRNRVTVVPLSGTSGTIDNWLGVQAVIDE
jgi:PAS domain S-box-containing protein